MIEPEDAIRISVCRRAEKNKRFKSLSLANCLSSRHGLVHSHCMFFMKNLPLQIGQIHYIVVYDPYATLVSPETISIWDAE